LPFFHAVQLGPHEEILRKALDADTVPKEYEYPFFVAPLVYDDNSLTDAIMAPSKSRFLGHRIYRFVFSGLLWVYVVSKNTIANEYLNICLRESGDLYMKITQLRDVDFIADLAEHMVEIGEF